MKSIIWKDHERKTAIEMAQKGHSYAEIASVIKRTRGAVAGFLNRSGVSIAKVVKFKPTERVKKVKPAPKKKAVVIQITKPFYYKGSVNIIDLESRACRFIADEVINPMLPIYCGNESLVGKAWCKDHYSLLYKRG